MYAFMEIPEVEGEEIHFEDAILKAEEDGAKNIEECIAWMNGYIRAINEIMERVGK